jgi:hypothetical protein
VSSDRIAQHQKLGIIPNKYHITKTDGRPMDPGAEYFVLRLDKGGEDKKHVAACRAAIMTYAREIRHHLPLLYSDLMVKYGPTEG